jgi:hypothetical protein
MMSRKPAALTRIKDPHRTIEVACFLRITLLRLTDASLTLLDHQIAALWRGARERVEVSRAGRLRRFRRLLGDLVALADDDALGAAELRSRLRSLIAGFEPEREATSGRRHSSGTWMQVPGSGSAPEAGAGGALGGSGRPWARCCLRDARFTCRLTQRVARQSPTTPWSVVARFDCSTGSCGGPRLLSRRV